MGEGGEEWGGEGRKQWEREEREREERERERERVGRKGGKRVTSTIGQHHPGTTVNGVTLALCTVLTFRTRAAGVLCTVPSAPADPGEERGRG